MNIEDFVKALSKYDVELESRYRWRSNSKKYNNDMKDSGIVPSMAMIGDNPCDKLCEGKDKSWPVSKEDAKLNGRIFNDWKDPREDTIDWE